MFLAASQPKGSSDDLSPLAHRDIRLVADALQCGSLPFRRAHHRALRSSRTAGKLVQQSSAGQIARIAQTTSIRGPALRLEKVPDSGLRHHPFHSCECRASVR